MHKKETLADRLKLAMEGKKISPTTLSELSGVKRQSISYILNNNLEKSKLSFQLASALGVSHQWLSEGVEDNSFLLLVELPVFNDIYTLLGYLNNQQYPSDSHKSLSHNKNIESGDFAFHDQESNIYYYCSKNQELESSLYFTINPLENNHSIEKLAKNKLSFPIVEKKTILVR